MEETVFDSKSLRMEERTGMKGRDTEKRHSLAVFKRMLKQGRYSLAILILFTILVLLSRVAIEEIILNNV